MLAARLVSNVRKVRAFSTKAPLTQAEIDKAMALQERYKKYNQKSPYPGNIPLFEGDGKDLDIPENPHEIAALTGMPPEQQERTVIIGPRPHKTSQEGRRLFHQWQLTWQPKGFWKNPLMGWNSTADPMTNVILKFNNREDAIAFANKNGWKYELLDPAHERTVPPEEFQYKDNFLDPKVMLKLAKEGKKCQEFALPGFGKSNWFMPLKYHGDGPVVQHGPTATAAAATA